MVTLKASAASRALEITRLGTNSAMKVQAAAGDSYRVLLPDGLTGYVPSRQTELASETLEMQQADTIQEVRVAPMAQAAVLEKVNGGEEFAVLGHYDGYMLVRTHKEKVGWMMMPAAPSSSKLPE
jgi:hypothetical protein